MSISEKINNIKKIKDFAYLLDERQDKIRIQNYYNTNKLAYLMFHNKSGYLHMGISIDGRYRHSDLLEQIKIIGKQIDNSSISRILELGYGRGANLYELARLFPQKEFIGVDLSTNPLKKYRINNTNFIQADYDNLSSLVKDIDLVFAIETLCHSTSLANTLNEIYSIMKPGAKLIIFDGYYLKDFGKLDEETKDACILTERGMAVDHFHNLDDFKAEAEKIGLTVVKEENYSDNILPTLFRFEKQAKIFFHNPLFSKFVSYLLPEMFTRNALSGYLMPELIESKIASYYLHVLQKGK